MPEVVQRTTSPDRGGYPPNPAVATSESHHVTAVDDEVTFVDRDAGTERYEASLRSFFRPVLRDPTATIVGEPRAAYDPIDDSFYLVATAREGDRSDVEDAYFVVGASHQGDPTRGWNFTRVDPELPAGYWVSFPGLGFDENHVYLTANVFDDDRAFSRSQFVAADKHELLWRSSVTYNRVDGLRTAEGWTAFRALPCQNYGWGTHDTAWCIWAPYHGGTHVEVLEIPDPLRATPEDVVHHRVEVPDFDTAPRGAAQPGTDDRLWIHGASFVRRGVIVDDSLWCAHAVGYDTDGDGERESRIDWYEIDLSGPVRTRQARDVTPARGYLWAPAVERDRSGATAILSHYASASTPASIATHVRTDTDEPGAMESALLHGGESGYDTARRDGVEFWGESTAVANDPRGDGAFVGYGQYPTTDVVDDEYGRVAVAFEV